MFNFGQQQRNWLFLLIDSVLVFWSPPADLTVTEMTQTGVRHWGKQHQILLPTECSWLRNLKIKHTRYIRNKKRYKITNWEVKKTVKCNPSDISVADFWSRDTIYPTGLRKWIFCGFPRFATVTYGKHSIRYLGPKLWSHLMTDERNCQSLNTFKKIIRKRDFSNFLNNERCNCRLCEF